MKQEKITPPKELFIRAAIQIQSLTNLFLLLTLLSTLLFSCKNSGRPKFEGMWKSTEGVSLSITKVTKETYDVKVLKDNVDPVLSINIPGSYKYEPKEKSIYKATDGEDLEDVKIKYTSDSKLYITGPNVHWSFFSRE